MRLVYEQFKIQVKVSIETSYQGALPIDLAGPALICQKQTGHKQVPTENTRIDISWQILVKHLQLVRDISNSHFDQKWVLNMSRSKMLPG